MVFKILVSTKILKRSPIFAQINYKLITGSLKLYLLTVTQQKSISLEPRANNKEKRPRGRPKKVPVTQEMAAESSLKISKLLILTILFKFTMTDNSFTTTFFE